MKNIKSLFSILIVLLLSVLCFSSSAFATDTTVTDASSLKNAFNSAQDGDTITLGTDIVSTSVISVPAAAIKVTLNLGNHTLTFSKESTYLKIPSGAELIINAEDEGGITSEAYLVIYPMAGSTVEINGGKYTAPPSFSCIQSKGNLTINSGTLTGKSGIVALEGFVDIKGGTIRASSGNGLQVTGPANAEISGNSEISSESGNGLQIAQNKTESSQGASVVMKNGSITGAYGVTIFANSSFKLVNGNVTGTEAIGITTNGQTNILDPFYGVNAKIEILGGKVSGVIGLYLPSYDGETIISGGEITGYYSGVEIRAGSLSVSGEDTIIKSTYDSEFTYIANGGGSTTFGAALAVSQHTSNDDISVEIDGGKFVGPKSFAAIAPQNETNTFDKGFDLKIKDGNFDGEVYVPEGANVTVDEDTTIPVKNFISGGTFTPPIGVGVGDESRTEFLAENIVAAVFSADEEEGTSKANGSAQYFTKMDEAIKATQGAEGASKQLVPAKDIDDTTGLPDNSEETSSTTIIIDLDGGTLPEELVDKVEQLEEPDYYYCIVPNTGEIVALGSPTKDGYKFAGWTVNGSKLTGTELVIDSTTNETKTVQATWSQIKPEPEKPQRPSGGNTGSTGSIPGGIIPDTPNTPDTPDTPDVPDTPDTEKPSDNGFNWNRPGTNDEGTSSENKEAVTIYRVYNSESGEHLFTTEKGEVQNLIAHGWNDEGTAWNSPKSGTPVYRLYSPVTGEHLYTLDQNEVSVLTAAGTWNLDNNGDPVFYSGGNTPIYRCYHEGLHMHHLTTDINEYHVVTENGWNNEGIAFYAN